MAPLKPGFDLPSVRLHSRRTLLATGLDGDPLDIFHSYCIAGGKLHVATRRVRSHNWPDSVIAVDDMELDFGADPRAFMHNGEVHCVATAYTPGYGFRNHLYRIDDAGFQRDMMIVEAPIAAGKNWAPFTFPDGKLGCVHSFDPPVILRELRRERGLIILSASLSDDVVTEVGPGGFSAFRGGTCGLEIDGLIVGVGHTTRFRPGTTTSNAETLGFEHLYHRPYGWILNPNTLAMLRFDMAGEFPEKFDGIDPTSLIRHEDGAFEVFTTEVSRHFHDEVGQREVASYRFELDPDFRAAARRALEFVYLPTGKFQSVNAVQSGGAWRKSLADTVGHIIYGPYIRLPSGTFELTFDYDVDDYSDDAGKLILEIVAAGGRFLATSQVAAWQLADGSGRTLIFQHDFPEEALEFRIAVDEFRSGQFAFHGVRYRIVPQPAEAREQD